MGEEIRPNYYKLVVPCLVAGRRLPVEVECFDLIDVMVGGDFYLGNAVKYLFRAGRKTESKSEDLRKAITYLEQAIKRAEGDS